MPWNGDGTFTQVVGPSPLFTGSTVWQLDATNSILIESGRHDYHDEDLAQGIAACINKNGLNSPTTSINWGGFKITNAGYGSANTDYACYGQVPISASLDASTNILTLSPQDTGLAFTVDLTPLVVGGSTANFAKLNATTNAFTGSATFVGTLESASPTTQTDQLSGGQTWLSGGLTPTQWQLANTAGGSMTLSGNSGAVTLKLNANTVWDTGSLTPAQVAGMLTATSSPTLTGSWNFNAAAVILPQNVTIGATGGGWQTSISSNALSLFSIATGATVKFDLGDTGSTTRILAGSNRVWTNGNMRVFASAVPTGGAANDIAFVLTGANAGVWGNNAGTWVKIAS